jgi:hypothetical protein
MSPRPNLRLGLLVASAAIGLAGCGSSSSNSSATSQSASLEAAARTQFVTQAERICSKLSSAEAPLKARQEALKGAAEAPSEKAFVSIAGQVVTLSRAAAKQLARIPRPAADATAITIMLNVYNDEIADVSDLAHNVSEQEGTSGEAAESALKRAVATDRVEAQRFGIKACTGQS